MRTFLVLVVFGLAACGGSDNGSGNLSNDSTLRDVCTAFGEVACDKADECGGSAPANCVSTFVSACCSGGTCDQKIGNASQIESCLDDLRGLTCAQLEGEDISLASCNTP